MNTLTYTSCPACGLYQSGKFCSECGTPLTGNPNGRQANGFSSGEANPYESTYRPDDPSWQDYWSSQAPPPDDFAASLAGLLVLSLAGLGVYTIFKSISNNKQLEGE